MIQAFCYDRIYLMLEVLQDLEINLSPEPIIAVTEAVALFRQRKKMGPMLDKVRGFWSCIKEGWVETYSVRRVGPVLHPGSLPMFVADQYERPRM